MTILDTNVLIYDALTPDRLSAAALRAIEAGEAQRELYCSDITLWEVAMLIDKGRLDPGTDYLAFIRLALAARGTQVLPITPEIAGLSVRIPGLEHGDPADRIIVATAIHSGGVLITSDRKLRKTEAIATIW